MFKKRVYADLKNIGKKIIPKNTLKKIKSLKDKDEKIESLKFSIKSNTELKYHDLMHRIVRLKMEKKDTLLVELKMDLLKNKIRYFYINYDKKDFIIVNKLLKNINKEVNKIV
jgi:hypothetical protein